MGWAARHQGFQHSNRPGFDVNMKYDAHKSPECERRLLIESFSEDCFRLSEGTRCCKMLYHCLVPLRFPGNLTHGVALKYAPSVRVCVSPHPPVSPHLLVPPTGDVLSATGQGEAKQVATEEEDLQSL